jgi:precorrin-8X/cobalt-precorrin-8 methylmutase
MPGLFDHYVIVDWSAANHKKTGRDSIWICRHGTEPLNVGTRAEARAHLTELLSETTDKAERVLIGFDFPFGYPTGFAQRLGFKGEQLWRSVWDEIARLIKDRDDNRNNRFCVGAELNRRVSDGRFPFWGCPTSSKGPFLGTHHHQGHTSDEPLKERRLIDCWMRGAQPCWKLAYPGSVGSQSLTGIPVVRELRDNPRWIESARIWPFETGLKPPGKDVRIVFAEVWPSWWPGWKEAQRVGEVNDSAQVRHVAEILADLDAVGTLDKAFGGDPSLTTAERTMIETEEAWTLGVMAPRRRASSRVTARHPDPLPASGEREDEPSPKALAPLAGRGRGPHVARKGEGQQQPRQTYLRDPKAIYRRSFAAIRAEADLARFPQSLHPLALRLAHAAGYAAILDNLVWSRGAVLAGRRALADGAPILVDGMMLAAGIIENRLPAQNRIICTLRDPAVPNIGAEQRTTRSAAAVELWRSHLDGAVVAIGNAPTALFRLLEIVAEGAARPALILGFPVGFVGAAEAKEALIGFNGVAYIALRGRRGGSALAAAAINALAPGRQS